MSITAMKQALEALEVAYGVSLIEDIIPKDAPIKQAITALRAAIAEVEKQEPVACKTLCELCVKRGYTFCANAVKTTPINTPPQRKPLTDEEIDDIWNRYCDEMGEASINDAYDIARAIEAKLKEKNT